MTLSARDLARCIDQTLFAPETSQQKLEAFCAEARRHSFFSVCVNSSRVELACSLLEESGVQVTALVGFPLGAADMDAKRFETEIAIDQGAQEIDFVLNLGWLKDRNERQLLREMRDVVEAADERPVKVILESHLLERDEKILACRLALDAGVQFVCTATDFNSPAASIEDVKLLREAATPDLGIKAAGVIRDSVLAFALLEAGASRIGTTVGPALLSGLP